MVSPIKVIKQTLETVIEGIVPYVPTAYEGVDFIPPDGIYQRVQIIPRRPDDTVLGDAYYRENVDLQIFVSAPSGNGLGDALDQAELLRNTFPKGWHTQVGNIRLNVLRTPGIGGTMILDSRVVIPVYINLLCEVG